MSFWLNKLCSSATSIRAHKSLPNMLLARKVWAQSYRRTSMSFTKDRSCGSANSPSLLAVNPKHRWVSVHCDLVISPRHHCCLASATTSMRVCRSASPRTLNREGSEQ